MSKKGLGRGLGALIPEVDMADRDRDSILEVPIDLIDRNPKQPRRLFDQAKLDELADSIREHGLVQPILVRPRQARYEIVAGERRWRAAVIAGLTKVAALVRDFSEVETMEIALIENLQREDLNPMEEAEAFRTLLTEFKLTQDELAKRLGKSRPQIANTLRLLQLTESVQRAVRDGSISMGHAKVLAGIGDVSYQTSLAVKILDAGLSVRQLEALLKHEGKGGNPTTASESKRAGLTPDLADVERQLREWFGTPVKLVSNGSKGRIEITFFGEDGLGRVLDALGLGDQERGRPPKGSFRI